MRGRHRTGAAIGNQQRDTIGRLNREPERCFVGHDDVGLWLVGVGRRHSAARSPHDDIRTVDLPQSLELRRLDRKRSCHVTPGRGFLVDGSRAKRPLACCI